MKKSVLGKVVCSILVLMLAGCGAADSGSGNDTRELKMEERSEDNLIVSKPVVKSQEIWDDNYIIPLSDDNLYREVRNITRVTERDITYGDVKYITELTLDQCHDASCLRFFTGLEKLYIGHSGIVSDLKNLDISNLHNLTELTIDTCSNLTTVEINNRIDLKKLVINNCNSLTSIDGLRNLAYLTELTINECSSLEAVEIDNQMDLEYLSISGCYSLKSLDVNRIRSLKTLIINERANEASADGEVDNKINGMTEIKGLGNLTNIVKLELTQCNNLKRLESLENLVKLESMAIYGCNGLESIEGIGALTNLKECTIVKRVDTFF